MSDPAPRRPSSTGLRLADLNKTYHPINGVVETAFVTALDASTVEVAERIFFETVGEDRVTIWFVNAIAGHDLKSDAAVSMGRFVARVRECGCSHLILATPNANFQMLFRSIMLSISMHLEVFPTLEKANELLTSLREQRKREQR